MNTKPTLLIHNIGLCLTVDSEKWEGPLGIIPDAAISIVDDKIHWVGPRNKYKGTKTRVKVIDAGGALVTPGLIDCHTHMLFAGSRADEFFARLRGETYEAIGKKGGGIHRTSASTRAASDADLLQETRRRLDRSLRFGVTTVEVKNGYGLSTDEELRMLRLIGKIKHTVETIPTFLAHTIPKEWLARRTEYVRMVCEDMLPVVARGKLAKICDVFCERGAFSFDEAHKILTQAKKLGLHVKLHADQLSNTEAASLAAKFDALSADHLEFVSSNGRRALAKSGTVAVLLPGAAFSMGNKLYPDARKLIDAGVEVALSTDCNPGTSFSENLPLIMSLAAAELEMTVDEIWKAVTLHAANALGISDRGMIRSGKKADLVIWDAETPEEIPYHYGASFARRVVKSGRPISTL